MKIGWIPLGIALVALFLSQGQAKDYREIIGPYQADFALPDDIASNTKVNKTITSGEELDGTTYHTFSIDFLIPENDRWWGSLWIAHYNAALEMNLAGTAENAEGDCRSTGYNLVKSDRRIIDGHEGYIVQCTKSETYSRFHRFAYQLDNQTIVGGDLLSLDWDTAVVPFLKSLHVKEVT